MSESLLKIRHFGPYLRMLASAAGYHSAKEFAEALSLHRKRRDNVGDVSERNVQRWVADKASPPEERTFRVVCLFLEYRSVLAVDVGDQRYYHLLELYHNARRRAPYRRKIERSVGGDAPKIASVEATSLCNILIAENHCDVAAVISGHPHNKTTTFMISKLISLGFPCERAELQSMIATVIVDSGVSDSDIAVASICANALAAVADWRPDALTLERLHSHFDNRISKDPFGDLTLLSPLAFSLARMGYNGPIQRIIDLLLKDTELGKLDFEIISSYYGDELNQIMSICSHFEDRKRVGLMVAHDTHRLLRLKDRTEGRLRDTVVQLLRQSGAALIAGGLEHQGLQIIKLDN